MLLQFLFKNKLKKPLIDVNHALPVLKKIGAGDKYKRSAEVLIYTKNGNYYFAQYCENMNYQPSAKYWSWEGGSFGVNDVVGWLPKDDLPQMPTK